MVQIDWRKLLGTGSFSPAGTPVRPIAAGAAPRDSNFEDAVTSFVYTAHMPFHPERLYKFVTKHFHLHQRDWGAEMAAQANDALRTIQQASKALSMAALMLPKDKASVKRAAELAAMAAKSAAAEAAAAGLVAPKLKPVQKLAEDRPSGVGPFGRLLRSKGHIWLAGSERYDHVGEWSLAGDVLQLTSAGPWIVRLPLKLWPVDDVKRAIILKDLNPGIGDRCACLCNLSLIHI